MNPAPSQSIRVVHVVLELEGGGLESLVGAMAVEFSRSPVVMSVITLNGRPGRIGLRVRPHLEQLHCVRPIPVLSMLLPIGLARAIRRTGAAVVHIHSGAWFKAALAARLAGVRRVVFTEHGREHADPPLQRWLDRRAAALTDAVVAVSGRLRDYLGSVVGIPEPKLRIIENGVDLKVFHPGQPPPDLRARFDIPEGALVVGSVGRLEAVKAYDQLIRAFAGACAAGLGRPAYLVLCGDGSQRAALVALADQLGVADAVRFPGWVERPAEVYRLLDLFVLSSVSEGASVSLLEAMASGAVPVVTDVGANAELLGPELADLVVPPGDVDRLREVLAAALRDPERRRRLATQAARRVAERYSLSGMVSRYADLYGE